jgi:hypothetical protein
MVLVIANRKDAIRERINVLITYWLGLDKQLNDQNVACANERFNDRQTMQESKLALEVEIEEMMDEYFGIKKEAATGHGDYSFNALKNIVAFSIPATEQEGKEGQASCH